MKKTIASLLVLCSFVVAEETKPSSIDDLKVILESSYLDAQCEPLLNMCAMEAITESGKKADSSELVELFKTNFTTDENLISKFCEPYKAVFTDEEISALRNFIESPISKKFSKEGMSIFQTNMQNLKEAFKELAANYGIEKTEEEVAAVADIVQVTQDNYSETVQNANLPIVLDVNASWCNPCRMMEPIIDELSEEYKDQIQFAKVDFDSQAELVKKFGVTSLPTIVFLKPGQEKPVMKSVGFMSKKDFEAKISEFMKK